MSALIMIIEDEPDLVSILEYNLVKEGYQTRAALDGRTGLALAEQEPRPDLVLLDLMLPDISGTEVCRQLRSRDGTRDVPVIIITARDDEVDRVVGFEIGADDYVTKPFSVRELMLRVRALLRRAQRAEQPAEEGGRTVFGCLVVDEDAHRAWVEEEEIRLTALEFRLLVTFLDRRGRAQSRERLLSDVWGYEADVTTRTVDTHVKRLREKLGAAGVYVETVRGIGYRFRDRPDGVA